MNDNLIVNYLRVISALQINKANSGHSGICLGAAPIIYSIYKNALVNPKEPNFINRDRIVFSAGHGSALIYSCLNLFGFDVSLQDLKNFRQINSITTGHPEVNVCPGIDSSSGPLGQGIANAVGFAIAEEYLRNNFIKENISPINHYTYCFTGDGCLMEGVAQEAISIAGNLKLSKLIMLYDKNDITIEGSLDIANREDTRSKFISCGWNVLEVEDGNNVSKIDNAITLAKQSDKPTLIIVKTQIGYGSELVNSNKVHGKPLSTEQIQNLKQNLSYCYDDWQIPDEVKKDIANILKEKNEELKKYNQQLEEYKNKYSEDFMTFNSLEENFKINLSEFINNKQLEEYDAREENHKILNLISNKIPNLIGGCADVAPSTKVFINTSDYFNEDNKNNKNIPYGIREHAMGAISNGISLHGGLRAFCSTFFAFENYLTPAIRMSALMKNPVLYIFTHDSIWVGEDGPTHQSTEQIATLRCMPDIYVFRPAGRNELLAGYQLFFNNNFPVALVLPRQVTGFVKDNFEQAKKGGYVISCEKDYEATIVATGSEVAVALEAQKLLKEKNILVNVVSMPCVELFEEQDEEYKKGVINKKKPVFCIEASTDNIWYKYATSEETILKLNGFGFSAKPKDVVKAMGMTSENLVNKVQSYLLKK